MHRDRVLLFCTLLICFFVGGIPAARALAKSVISLQNPPAITVNATGDPELLTALPSVFLVDSVCIQNTGATCVNVGGADVSTTTGIAVGDGCAAGKVFCLDARLVYAEAQSGTASVTVLYGAQQ